MKPNKKNNRQFLLNRWQAVDFSRYQIHLKYIDTKSFKALSPDDFFINKLSQRDNFDLFMEHCAKDSENLTVYLLKPMGAKMLSKWWHFGYSEKIYVLQVNWNWNDSEVFKFLFQTWHLQQNNQIIL